MKRIYLLMFAVVLTVLGVSAEGVTATQAQAVAQRFVRDNQSHFASSNTNQNLQLAHVAYSNGRNVDYYVFNLKADGGYIIVGGDDLAQPVWGYSAHGAFEFGKLPENMRWWLSEYQRQLDWLREHSDAKPQPALTLSSSVAPLLTSTWDQFEPYNNLCPVIRLSGRDYVAPSGCLATAMAQTMNYYQWPLQGAGSHSYTFTTDGGTEMTLSANFAQSTYDWNNMLNSYAGSYNNTQAQAVAKLMSDAGISIDMQYNAYESTAYYNKAIEALMSYFDYSPSMSYRLKDSYNDDWEALLRAELDAHRPIFYFGQNPNNAGHAFVMDGYNADGYFHINWGWNGDFDGYFETSLLRPNCPNNNPDVHNYSYRQGAITGIEPDNTGTGGIVLKSGIIPTASTMPANDVRASFDVEAVSGPYNGTLKFIVCTKTGDDSYSWYYSNVVDIDVSLAAGERKTIKVSRSFNYLDEGETYYFFLINPYVTIANYYWCTPVAFTVGNWPFALGDVNGDGKISIGDVTVLIDYLLDNNAPGVVPYAADVNGDNNVSIADISALIDKLLNNN